MSRIPALLGAAALFVSVSAFAQTATTPAPTTETPAASSGMSGDTANSGKAHHAHHHDRSAMGKSTDMSADKLNACMANATPTPREETCLKQASQS